MINLDRFSQPLPGERIRRTENTDELDAYKRQRDDEEIDKSSDGDGQERCDRSK